MAAFRSVFPTAPPPSSSFSTSAALLLSLGEDLLGELPVSDVGEGADNEDDHNGAFGRCIFPCQEVEARRNFSKKKREMKKKVNGVEEGSV